MSLIDLERQTLINHTASVNNITADEAAQWVDTLTDDQVSHIVQDIPGHNEDPVDDNEDHDDVHADAEALASAGHGTDEDYGHFGGDD